MNVWKYEVQHQQWVQLKRPRTQWKPDSHSSLAGVLAEWSWKEKQTEEEEEEEEEEVFFFSTEH